MNQELTVREPMALSPAEVVENSTTQAKLLMDIVEKTGCYQQIRDKKYLQVEAWETIGAFNRTHAETEYMKPITKDGETIGYEAKVQLWRDGIVIGGAIMPCFFTENACKGKEGDAKHKASMSAAQTFATSKAYRMNFSYVAILAGYSATPAEEMTGEDSTTPDHTQHSHYCKEHKVNYFKSGKMRGYAHKIEGTDEWCNEPEPPKAEKPAPTKQQEAPSTATSEVLHPEEPEPSIINLDWLKEQQEELLARGLESWDNKGLKDRIDKITGCKSAKVSEAVGNLTKEQGEAFVKTIQDTLEMA